MGVKLVVLLCFCFIGVLDSAEEKTTIYEIAGIAIDAMLTLVFQNVKRYDNLVLADNLPITIPEDVESVIGTLDLTTLQLSGLNTLGYQKSVKVIDTKIIINMALLFEQLRLSTKYDADMGIVDEVPIYGTGDISAEITKLAVGLNNVVIDLADITAPTIENDVAVSLAFRDGPISISGFWKQERVSNVLSSLLSLAEKFVAMWFTYENDYINCLLSGIVNAIIKKPEDGAAIVCPDPSSAQGSILNRHVLEFVNESLNGKTVRALVDVLNKQETRQLLYSGYKQFTERLELDLQLD